jgi:ATPase subunit of ABC transporter with duplicated ATPase domains
MSLVVLDDVTLFFGDRLIFDGASLRLGHGDKLGFIGPNGSARRHCSRSSPASRSSTTSR